MSWRLRLCLGGEKSLPAASPCTGEGVLRRCLRRTGERSSLLAPLRSGDGVSFLRWQVDPPPCSSGVATVTHPLPSSAIALYGLAARIASRRRIRLTSISSSTRGFSSPATTRATAIQKSHHQSIQNSRYDLGFRGFKRATHLTTRAPRPPARASATRGPRRR